MIPGHLQELDVLLGEADRGLAGLLAEPLLAAPARLHSGYPAIVTAALQLTTTYRTT